VKTVNHYLISFDVFPNLRQQFVDGNKTATADGGGEKEIILL